MGEMSERGQLQEGVSVVGPDDYARVLAVWEASVRATHHFLAEADIQAIKPLVLDDLAQLEHLVGVRDADGQVVGFMGVDGVEVAALFIDPAWRGQGIGRQLFNYAIDAFGASQVDVNEQNDQAVGFYRRMGFEVIGRSAMDGLGQPFPLLHMRRIRLEQVAE